MRTRTHRRRELNVITWCRYRSEGMGYAWHTRIKYLWDDTTKKSTNGGRHRRGKQELREGAKASLSLFLYLLHMFNYPPKKLSQNVSRLHPTSFPPSTKDTGEPQERLGGRWPLKIVDMLAGVVRRLYEVSRAPNVGGRGEACQEFWKHREHWDKVNGTVKKQPDESRIRDMP